MTPVIVESHIDIEAPPPEVWRHLCDARLPLTAPCCFTIGVPRPETCRLVGDASGVGAQRQCQTDRGTIDQTITEWEPPKRLSFVATANTLGLERHIRDMRDTFTIQETRQGSRLTRTTRLATDGIFAVPKAWVFGVSVRFLHRYVLRNFKALAEGRG